MLHINKKLTKSDWLLIVIYWSIAYIYIVPAFFVKGRIFETLLLSLIEVAARTFLAVTILFLLFPGKSSIKNIVFAVIKAALIISLLTPLFMIGDAYYNAKELDWSFRNIAINVLSEAQEIGILCAILAMKQFYNIQAYTRKLEKLNIENQLKALNSQVNPHFLFNNLNVLSGLISQNPTHANEFVNRLALVYRHLITNAHNDIVLLIDELSFADDYIYLLEKRFENAYVFKKNEIDFKNYSKFLPTCSLQSVLENIIKHNKGDNHNPLQSTISIYENEVVITNQKRLKNAEYETTGIGLVNLKNRYELLSDKQIEIIVTDENYTIKLPLLTATNYVQ
jgi:two-component system, LytTR family, sensor kinase